MHHLIIIILLIKMGLMFIFLCILCVVQLLNADLDCKFICLKKKGGGVDIDFGPPTAPLWTHGWETQVQPEK